MSYAVKDGKTVQIDLAHIRHNLPLWYVRQVAHTGQLTIEKFTLKSSVAIVRIRAHGEDKYISPRTKQISTLSSAVVADDTWIKQGRKWLRLRARIISY